MTKKETDDCINTFKTNNWDACIQWIKDYWNTDYGTFEICKEKNGITTIELTTGGWSENEYIIDMLADTMFWFLWWQESKRGGYYKFIYTEKINYESEEIENGNKNRS